MKYAVGCEPDFCAWCQVHGVKEKVKVLSVKKLSELLPKCGILVASFISMDVMKNGPRNIVSPNPPTSAMSAGQ